MEHESFENKEIADRLNQNYISIKVDREERPDIDAVYMSACHSLNGQGGWPLTILMTPEGIPFYAATYLPPENRFGMSGLKDLLKIVSDKWKNEKGKLYSQADYIQSFLKQHEIYQEPEEPSKKLLYSAVKEYKESLDSKYGGFGTAPKFPIPHNLLFLLRYGTKEGDKTVLSMAELSLKQMYRGGIFDHIGGGFSRYSTDEKWLVPHFEKMLYDNALLTIVYLEAYVYTKKKLYLYIAEEILQYVQRELADKEGGFYCGQDADSDGIEGKYYVFQKEELKNVLGKEDMEYFCDWFGITNKGNFEGKNILNLLSNPNYNIVDKRIAAMKDKVFHYRQGRTKLHKDDKILLSWNALMIAAFAKAYAVTKNQTYRKIAEKAEEFIFQRLIKKNRLLVRYRDGESKGEGKIDDYAFYNYALLELYNATFEIKYLEKAVKYTGIMIQNFFDMEQGGFYHYSNDGEQLFLRSKEIYDGAVPSGNSVAAYVLERLSKLTGEKRWQEIFEKQVRFLSGNIKKYPSGYSFFLLTLLNIFTDTKELLCLSPSVKDIEDLREKIMGDAGLSILIKTKENKEKLIQIAPYTDAYELPAEGSLFYLCSGTNCMKPTDAVSKLLL